MVARDAGVVEKLTKGGAVILGKASLSEWYSFRSLGHVPIGWCARAGQGVVSCHLSFSSYYYYFLFATFPSINKS